MTIAMPDLWLPYQLDARHRNMSPDRTCIVFKHVECFENTAGCYAE